MIENRIETFSPEAVEQSKTFTKIIDKLSKDLSDEQHPDQYSKKSLAMYLNTFAFEAGFNPPSDQQLNLMYYYLQDNKKSYITKTKFQFFLRKCLGLYIEAKKEPIGGIIDRLVILLRSQAYKQKQMEIK